MERQTMKFETYMANPAGGRRVWFCATAKSDDGMKWNIDVVADYVPSETHVLYEMPLALFQERFLAWQVAIHARALEKNG
jgi:hypothetical protein